MSYDLKITGGTIVDGTGAKRYLGDLGIKDGRIVAMGGAPAEAQRTIDATGRIVAPGFVDIHTHYDAQVLWDPLVSCSPWHGVTTIVMGNCGFSVAPTRPEHRDLIMRTLENVEGMSVDALRAGLGDWGFETFPEYLDALDANGCAVNMAAMIGHTALRMYVLGEEAANHLQLEHLIRKFSIRLPQGSMDECSLQEIEQLINKSSELPPLTFSGKSILDGNQLMNLTAITRGPKLGNLKSWLHRIQIERDIQSEQEMIQILSTIMWQNSDGNEWPKVQFP